MVKGEATQTKIHYKGKDEDFVIFVDDMKCKKQWEDDKSVPMAHFISAFKVFVTHKHGAQGQLDDAPKSTLSNEFGTDNVDEAIKIILEKGTPQQSEFPERQGPKNDSQMGSISVGR